MSIQVRPAETEEDLRSIYRLRYQVYINEMGLTQTYADHKAQEIREPFDQTGVLLMAVDEGETVGTVRVNFRTDGPLEAEELYDLHLFGPFVPDTISMTTKLIVKASHRNSMAASLLATTAYRLARDRNSRFNFIDTKPHLVRLYQQMGYRLYRDNIHHPDFGDSIPMVIVTDDMEYFRDIRSPFVRYAKHYENPPEAADYFKEHFPHYAAIRPLFSMPAGMLWERFTEDLNKSPRDVLTFLKGFNEDESQEFLRQVDLVEYAEGDVVFREGAESNGMFCILSGSVEILAEAIGGGPIAILNQGETFGEMGFVARSPRSATVVVRRPSRLLVLSEHEFRKIVSSRPALAVKFITNLFAILVQRFTEKSQALGQMTIYADRLMEALGSRGDETADELDDQSERETEAAFKERREKANSDRRDQTLPDRRNPPAAALAEAAGGGTTKANATKTRKADANTDRTKNATANRTTHKKAATRKTASKKVASKKATGKKAASKKPARARVVAAKARKNGGSKKKARR